MIRLLISLLALAVPTLVLAQGFTPEEAVKRMQVPPGFQVKIAACEPMIRQPLSVEFDERGRMWVLQYLQYPNPAGLKPVKQDQYLRTIWDRVPEPPPKGPKGADRITICYDPDENGRFRKSKDFLSDLNLCSGFCLGNGGVYVLQSPYLLFYADKNNDDVPDNDPEVLLKGFGFDDTHSVANSLQFGPDGWLYGAAGSTSTSKIDDPSGKCKTPIEFQQGIWRYHPKTKQFELFSEGGGNTFGLDFDKHGQVIAGTNNGGKAMLHQMQGAYYIKGFSKHGPLHNAHAYGYFDHVPYKNFKGGHVTCGGIVYQGDAYPSEYQDQYIAGNLLSNALYWHKLTPKGASFEAEHGGDFLIANDTWFRPIDCFTGPDGSIFVADWYDKRAAHLDPIDNWDKTNGRIYKIEFKGTKQLEPFDLSKKTSAELLELLKHPNKWWRNEARRLLAEKGADKQTIEALKKWAVEEKGVLALEALWVLYGAGAVDDALASKLLKHSDEYMRAWTIRLIGEYYRAIEKNGTNLLGECADLAQAEQSPIVVAQLAATAKYIPGGYGYRLADLLVWRRDTIPADPALPLMLWWAVESKWQYFELHPFGWMRQEIPNGSPHRLFILERMARLAAATNSRSLLSLLIGKTVVTDAGPHSAAGINHAVLTGIDLGLGATVDEHLKVPLVDKLRQMNVGEADPLVPRLLVRLGDEPTYQSVLKQASDAKLPDAERLKKFDLLAEMHKPDALPLLLEVFQSGKGESLRAGALTALQAFSDPKVGEVVLALFPRLTGKLRLQAQALLLSRPSSAQALLQLVDNKALDAKQIPPDQVRPVLAFNEPAITKLVEKHWGKLASATPGEKLARIGALNNFMVRNPGGTAMAGKAVFTKSCAVCHTLFGEGGKVGPDLTASDRKNRIYLLTHIVDPSLYIRPEFVSFNITLADGRKLNGLVGESAGESLTLLNVVNDQVQKTVLAKANIDEMFPSPVSLMPEKLLDTMKNEEVRDLLAYLQSEPPAKPKDGKKLKVLLISGSLEYNSDDSLAQLQKHLEANYPVECVRAFRKADDDLPGLEALDTCDVAVFFTRRLTIKGEQLERIKKYAASGKPIVGIRTASHGFQNWLEMDKEVFGGDYNNHYKAGPKCEVKIVDAAKDHPILKGLKPFMSEASLYKNADIAKDNTVLLTGTIPENTVPIAWVREHKGGRVFYTSLGHPDDFKNDGFVRMIANAIFWTTKRDVPAK
jgi:putative membrane-bound dehydrogenase-like protein